MQEVRNSCSVARLRRSPGAGNGNTLQDSWLENPMDRGAWQATVHGVEKSWTRLSDWPRTQRSQKSLDGYTHVTKDSYIEYREFLQVDTKKANKSVLKKTGDSNRYFTKEEIKWPVNIWKDAQEYCSSENWKLKPQQGITVHPLERLQLKRLSFHEDVEQPELPSMANNVECWQLLIKRNILLFYDPATPKRI